MAPTWVAKVLDGRRRDWLARRSTVRLAILLSAVLCAPSIGTGLQLDDHVHRVLVRHLDGDTLMWRTPPPAWDLFRFVDGDAADFRRGLEAGTAPWYASPDVRLAFFRPLASLTHAFDYALLDSAPWLMHVHSLFWLMVLGATVAARLVRTLESGWVAGLIVIFYVLDSGHGIPAGWLASRNQLMAGALGALALTEHVRWRRGEHATPAAPLFAFALGLLAGESMVGWLAFFVAYAWILDRTPRRRALLALAPYAILVAVWRVAYSQLGYGASDSALYIDPAHEPVRFAGALLARAPQLLAGPLGGPPAGFLTLLGPGAERAAIAVALVVLGLAASALLPLLRRDASARFWALGAILAVVPVAATQPHPRLMLIAGLGLAGVVARFIASVVESPRPARFAGVAAAAWLMGWLGVSPLRLAMESRAAAQIGRPNALAAQSVPEEAAGETLVVLAVPDPMFMCAQVPLVLASLERPRPARIRCIASVENSVEVERVDARTLVLRADDGLLSGFFVPLLRERDAPFPDDFEVVLRDVRVDLPERDDEGWPLAIRLRFTTPLEDPARVFVVWSAEARGFVRFTPPAVGTSVTVTGQPVGELFLE